MPESHNNPQGRSTTKRTNREGVPPSSIPDNQRELYQKLLAVGIWPDRVQECLSRYSARRIEANFELWRQRKNDSEAPPIGDDGAWLCAAITDGYADFGGMSNSGEVRAQHASEPGTGSHGTGGQPEHKQKVSPEEKERLIRRLECVEAGHFHRFRHAERPSEKQFLYLDPEEGGPTRKRRTT